MGADEPSFGKLLQSITVLGYYSSRVILILLFVTIMTMVKKEKEENHQSVN